MSGTDGRAPVDPVATEAGRLLCAGTYLDPAYRDRVIEELYVHEERFPPPSYGFDASRVLAHALRALRTRCCTAPDRVSGSRCRTTGSSVRPRAGPR